jgi:hypothetical protein
MHGFKLYFMFLSTIIHMWLKDLFPPFQTAWPKCTVSKLDPMFFFVQLLTCDWKICFSTSSFQRAWPKCKVSNFLASFSHVTEEIIVILSESAWRKTFFFGSCFFWFSYTNFILCFRGTIIHIWLKDLCPPFQRTCDWKICFPPFQRAWPKGTISKLDPMFFVCSVTHMWLKDLFPHLLPESMAKVFPVFHSFSHVTEEIIVILSESARRKTLLCCFSRVIYMWLK